MAHQLSIVNGVAEAAFAGEKPWHGLGTMVDNLMTPAQALIKAHLDWDVKKVPLKTVGGLDIKSHVATVRSDNGNVLGVVGKDWQPIQNKEQAEFIGELTNFGAVVECVGALFDGQITFWTCKIPGNLIIGKEDAVNKYLILCNGHNGMKAFRAFWSPIRVVCNNTLTAAVNGIQESVTMYHTKNAGSRIEEARHTLGVADQYYTEAGVVFNQMLRKHLDGAEFKSFLEDVFPAKDKEDVHPITQKARNRVSENFEVGRGHRLAGKTAWGAYNAVTEFVCHQRSDISTNDKRQDRFRSILMGSGREVANRAFESASKLAGVA